MLDVKYSFSKNGQTKKSFKKDYFSFLKKKGIRNKKKFNIQESDIRYVEKKEVLNTESLNMPNSNEVGRYKTSEAEKDVDGDKRLFLKIAGVAGLGMVASSIFPKSADAYIAGSTPTSNVVGVKNVANAKINPATEETVSALLTGQGVSKVSVNISASGIVHTPGSGKRIRIYASRFSLSSDATSISFRFTSGGTDYEKYISPKTGGLYGSNNHPNFIEGGIDEVLYCNIVGATTVQINIDYLEV